MYAEHEARRTRARLLLATRVKQQIDAQIAAAGPVADQYAIAQGVTDWELASIQKLLDEIRAMYLDDDLRIQAMWLDGSIVGRVVEVTEPIEEGPVRGVVDHVDPDLVGAVWLKEPAGGSRFWTSEDLILLPEGSTEEVS